MNIKAYDKIFLILMICAYITSTLYSSLWLHNNYLSSYFDMVSMYQPVYNSFEAIKKGNIEIPLEMTDPHVTPNQISRLSYHFDIILIPISLLLFIYEGPETLLVLQSVALGLSAIPLYLISDFIFKDQQYKKVINMIFVYSYLMFYPMHNANTHSFHPISLTPLFVLSGIYLLLTKKYFLSISLFVLAMFTKENVAITTAMFGVSNIINLLLNSIRHKIEHKRINPKIDALINRLGIFRLGLLHKSDLQKTENKNQQRYAKEYIFSVCLIAISAFWFYYVMNHAIPHFRGGEESYYLPYFEDFGSTPNTVILNIFKNPKSIISSVLNYPVMEYLFGIFASTSFLALLSPIWLLPAISEFSINILGSESQPLFVSTMVQYELVLQSYVFLAAIYGLRKLLKKFKIQSIAILLFFSVVSASIFMYQYSVNSYVLRDSFSTKEKRIKLIIPTKSHDTIREVLADVPLKAKVSATDKIAPHIASRKHMYYFDKHKYKYADIIIVSTYETSGEETFKVYNVEAYNLLVEDENFVKTFEENGIEVYKKKEY